jgi:hypothetical protein
MKTILIIYFLSVQTSYLDGTETPATDSMFDTVQFFSAGDHGWRIKTFATDQDVHIWLLDGKIDDIIDLARHNTEKHYGDVLTEGYIIETTEGIAGIRSELAQRGLATH